MINLRTQIKITIALGVCSLLSGLASHLALTDINHGEADSTLEWKIVQVSALIILAFIIMTFLTLIRSLRALA